MTLPELFHLLIDGSSMMVPQKQDAHALITDLQRAGAFGTLVAITSASHAYEGIPARDNYGRHLGYYHCRLCSGTEEMHNV
jgi:hypothetical protein